MRGEAFDMKTVLPDQKFSLRYIEFKSSSPKRQRNLVYERALKELPGSYKLWYNYLKLRRKQVKGR